MQVLIDQRKMTKHRAASIVADKLLWLWDSPSGDGDSRPAWRSNPELLRRFYGLNEMSSLDDPDDRERIRKAIIRESPTRP